MSQVACQHGQIVSLRGGSDGDVIKARLMSTSRIHNLTGQMGTFQVEWQKLFGIQILHALPPIGQSARFRACPFPLGLGNSGFDLSSRDDRQEQSWAGLVEPLYEPIALLTFGRS